MKNNHHITGINFLLVLSCLGIGLWFRSHLPPMLPTHFNIEGIPEKFSNRDANLVLLPMIALFSSILIDFLLRGDFNFYKKRSNRIATAQMNLSITVLLMTIYLGQIAIGLNHHIRHISFLSLSFALFLIIASFAFKKIDQNFIIGIRLPWTMISEQNWKKTHELSAKIMLPTGAFLLVISFSQSLFYLSLILFLLTFIVPTLYSYYLFKKS